MAGTYTVIASNPATGCSSNMAGSTTITINPLPTVYFVTGGGGYCPGGSGVHIGLSASAVGTSCQLMNGFSPVGLPLVGTGSALDFGPQTAPGSYSVVATTNPPNSCSVNMSGIVTVFINPAPAFYSVSGGGGYCAGGSGSDVALSGSSIGVNYQLITGGTNIGVPLAGTGFPIDFGLQTASGTYTVLATSTSTSCTSNMAGSAVVTINPAPSPFTVTGGGQSLPGRRWRAS